ncbi:MAG: hypothetical protein ACYDAN_02495 [Candidatus Limnocylindrales bacterium]
MTEIVTLRDLEDLARTLLAAIRAADKLAHEVGRAGADESISPAEAKRRLEELRQASASEIAARLGEFSHALREWSAPR